MKAQGVLISSGPEGAVEFDTITCVCCNGLSIIKHGCKPEDIGLVLDWYTNRLMCAACVDGDRSPFEEKLKRQEARAASLRSYRII